MALICCSRLRARWSAQPRAALLSSLIARQWVGLRALWRFQLGDLSIDAMVGSWCFGCCKARWGSPVGFPLLQYSVLCTVGSLSLLCLLFWFCFVCFRRCALTG